MLDDVTHEEDQEWRERAGCREEEPETFFPLGNPTSRGYRAQEAAALAICRRCPVVADCLAWAIRTEQRHGVSGGIGETGRRVLIAKARKRAGRRSRDVRELEST